MSLDRIHLVLEPHLMKAFREMAEKNRRSVSGQLAFMVDEEIDRQRMLSQPAPLRHRSAGAPLSDFASSENESHLPNP